MVDPVNSDKPWWDADQRKGPTEKPELESKVEKRFIRQAKKRGWKHRKLNGAGARDWHDQLILANGVICLIEFKRPDGKSKLSPGQEIHHDEVIALNLGNRSLVTDSAEEAIAFVEALCANKLKKHDPVPNRFRPKPSPPTNTKRRR